MGNMKELFESEMVKFGMFEHGCNAMNIDSETGSYSCKDTEAMFAGFKIAMHMVSEKTKIEKFREFECAETSYDYGFIEGFNEAIYRINEVTK